MAEAFICDYVRTPIGRFGGALSSVRADDLGAIPLRALKERNAGVDWEAIEEVYYGCANQAGEDNRNVARMATLLAGLPVSVPGTTLNRLCGSGMDAVLAASADHPLRRGRTGARRRRRKHVPRALRHAQGRHGLFAQRRNLRHHHRLAFRQSGAEIAIRRRFDARDRRERRRGFRHQPRGPGRLCARSQTRAGKAQATGRLAKEIVAVEIPRRKGDPIVVNTDEHPRPDTTLEQLAKLQGPVPRRRLGDSRQRVRRQ
jgi:acetyl-CoA acyltransferase